MAGLIVGAKEGPAPAINRFDDGFGDIHGSHMVERKSAQDRCGKGKPTSSGEEGSTPTCQVLITGGQKWKTIVHRNLGGGEGQPEICLGEGRYRGTKSRGQLKSKARGDSNMEEGGLMIINGKASSLLKELKEVLDLKDSLKRVAHEDQRVIGILEHRARITRNQRVRNGGSQGRVPKETMQDVGNNDEKVGKKRVPLLEAFSAVNPTVRDSVEEDNRFSCTQEVIHLG